MPESSKERRAEQKVYEHEQLERHITRKFFCGSCTLGFNAIEEYKEHCDEEEHNYHISRRIQCLVPGLGFCPACSLLIQTATGWDNHTQSNKHIKCIESLNAIGIEGDFTKPLGCSEIGSLGGPIEPKQISQKLSVSYGYGHGGKLGKNVPLVGLNFVSIVDSSKSQPTYSCSVCDEPFTYEHRGKHLSGYDHRLKFMEKYYPAWHTEVLTGQKDGRPAMVFRLMFYAHQAEKMELDQETEQSVALRKKFVTEVTSKQEHNKYRRDDGPPADRGRHLMHGAPRGRSRGMFGPPRGFGGPPRGFGGPPRGFGGPPRGFGGPPRGMRRPPHYPPAHTLPGRPSYGPPPRFRPRPVFRDEEEYYEESHLGKRGPVPLMGGSWSKVSAYEDPYAEAGAADQLGEVAPREDPYKEGTEEDTQAYKQALDAISVLEEFAMSKVKGSFKDRIDNLKSAVMLGTPELAGAGGPDLAALASRGRGGMRGHGIFHRGGPPRGMRMAYPPRRGRGMPPYMRAMPRRGPPY